MIAAASSAPPAWLLAPLALMLLSIALLPFLAPRWWGKYFPHAAIALGAIPVFYYLGFLHEGTRLLHAAHEYGSFIALIGSLYFVAGGIHVRMKGQARPLGNVLFLLIGALLANILGTTGASMLLIRPWLRWNRGRIAAFHVVFFIFLVSNVGGALTPIGDPPLFLGFLRGVPFWWVIQHCWLPWLILVSALLAMFYMLDRRNFSVAPTAVRDGEAAPEPWQAEGLHNLAFLAVILVGVFLSSPWRELLMIAAALGSWFLTPRRIHRANDFDFHPIKEVAWLFLGLFATMVPALDFLDRHAADLGIDSPLKFYGLTGLLSAFLDNAPAYLAFLAVAFGQSGLSLEDSAHMPLFLAAHSRELAAISLGSVFFGALTYIGNGPNFMVKAIAEQAQVRVPHFFAYLYRYALPCLLPQLALIAWLFFW